MSICRTLFNSIKNSILYIGSLYFIYSLLTSIDCTIKHNHVRIFLLHVTSFPTFDINTKTFTSIIQQNTSIQLFCVQLHNNYNIRPHLLCCKNVIFVKYKLMVYIISAKLDMMVLYNKTTIHNGIVAKFQP